MRHRRRRPRSSPQDAARAFDELSSRYGLTVPCPLESLRSSWRCGWDDGAGPRARGRLSVSATWGIDEILMGRMVLGEPGASESDG